MNRPSLFPLMLLAAVALVLYGDRLALPWGWVVQAKPDAVVILYEADNGEPPAYAAGAVNELRASGKRVWMIDDDPGDGENQVPDAVAPAIEPGRAVMGGTNGKGHALVVLAGQKVLKAVPLPSSREAIVEAAQ